MPLPNLVNRYALREAARERIALQDVEMTYIWPDEVRPSTHDGEREVRTRYFGPLAIEAAVDSIDDRVATVWRKDMMK